MGAAGQVVIVLPGGCCFPVCNTCCGFQDADIYFGLYVNAFGTESSCGLLSFIIPTELCSVDKKINTPEPPSETGWSRRRLLRKGKRRLYLGAAGIAVLCKLDHPASCPLAQQVLLSSGLPWLGARLHNPSLLGRF